MSDSYTNALLIYMVDMPSWVNKSVILTMSCLQPYATAQSLIISDLLLQVPT